MKTSSTHSPLRRAVWLALGIGSLTRVWGGQLIFNTDTGLVTLDDVPVSSVRGYAVTYAETTGGVARFKVAGDLALRVGAAGLNGTKDSLTARGAQALHLLVANDFIQEPGTWVDVSPQFLAGVFVPVAGGGWGGEVTTARGTGGQGGAGGGNGKPGGSVPGSGQVAGATTLPQGGDGGHPASPNNGFNAGSGTPGEDRIGSAPGGSGIFGFTGTGGLAGVNNVGVLSGLGGLAGVSVGSPGAAASPGGGGGAGGAAGHSIINADSGEPGGNGLNGLGGGNGTDGGPGASGEGGKQSFVGPAELLLTGGGGGGAGGSGAGGGGGAGGSSGGGGGGGGGAGMDTGASFSGAGGGGGGAGGTGGHGAYGGEGGAGGSGGGAIQITALGRLDLQGGLSAAGGPGLSGYNGGAGEPGLLGYSGGKGGQQNVVFPNSRNGSIGGDGGVGGVGGSGGGGGRGGDGSGGAGGTIKLIGTYIDAGQGQLSTRRGPGGPLGNGGVDGRLVLGHAAVDSIDFAVTTGVSLVSQVGLRAPYDQVPRMDNPYVQGATPRIAPRVAGVSGLLGGASAYGLLPASVYSDPQIAAAIAAAPAGATAMILRLPRGPVGFDQLLDGFSVLLYINFGAAGGLPQPKLNAGGDVDPQPLATLGWAREMEFGGNGIPLPLTSLTMGSVFAVLVEKDADRPGRYAFNDGTKTFYAQLGDGEARYNVDLLPVPPAACLGYIDFGAGFCPTGVSAGQMVGQRNGDPVWVSENKFWRNLPVSSPGAEVVNGVSFGPVVGLVGGKGLAAGERPGSPAAVAWVDSLFGGLGTLMELDNPNNQDARAVAAWTDNTTFRVVGETVESAFYPHAALWNIAAGNSTLTDLHQQLDGLLRAPPAISRALAVHGTTTAGVWYGNTIDDQRAVGWFGGPGGIGRALPIGGNLVSLASGVSANFIVGYVAAAGFQPHHACAWDAVGDNFTLLEPPGFVSSEAVACNGTQIIGFGRDAAGGQHLLRWTGRTAATAEDLTGVVADWGGTPFPTGIDDAGNISVCLNSEGPHHGYLLTANFVEVVGAQVTTSLQPRGGTFTAQVRPNCTATAAHWHYTSQNNVFTDSPDVPLTGGSTLTTLSLPLLGVSPGESRSAQLVVRYGNDQLAFSSFAGFTVPPNQPPEPRDFGGERLRGQEFRIPIGKLLAMAKDPEGDALSLDSVTPDPNGSTAVMDGGFVVYRPPGFGVDPDPGLGDYFTYTIRDSLGATAEGVLTLVVRQDGTPPPNLISITPGTAGAVVLQFVGIPGRTYRVQATDTLAYPVAWLDLGSVPVGANGIFSFTDTDAGNHPVRYYRTVTP